MNHDAKHSISRLTPEILAAVCSEDAHQQYPEEDFDYLISIAERSGWLQEMKKCEARLGSNTDTMAVLSFAITFLLIGWDARGAVEDLEKFRGIVTK